MSVTGWRMWRLVDGKLMSLHRDTVWEGPVFHAERRPTVQVDARVKGHRTSMYKGITYAVLETADGSITNFLVPKVLDEPLPIGTVVTIKDTVGIYARKGPRPMLHDLSQFTQWLMGIADRTWALYSAAPLPFTKHFPIAVVCGRVSQYGHIVEHDLVYRSEHAVIEKLWIFTYRGTPEQLTQDAHSLSETYHCDVLPKSRSINRRWRIIP